MMSVDDYLTRISYSGPKAPTLLTLRRLHRAHMEAVPFENLDIHLGKPIILEESSLYEKIVVGQRGGFCYELNGLFAWLLRQIGYSVTLLSARVTCEKGGFGPEFDHLALRVDLAEAWLADVGFGDSFLEPLRLNDRGEQPDQHATYRIDLVEGTGWMLLKREEDSVWKEQYSFTPQPRSLGEFADMCHYHQTSPESPFTRRRICSIAAAGGRVTLSEWQLIETRGNARHETGPLNPKEYKSALKEHFHIIL